MKRFDKIVYKKGNPIMKKLRKNSNQKFIALAVVSLLAISIGYAALSTTLTIQKISLK